MTYVVEAGSSRRSRRRRAGITLLVVVLMLFFAFWYAYSYYRSDGTSASPTACPSPSVSATGTGTATTAAAPPVPAKTLVNVYNSTNRTGLAAGAAKLVRQRGFVVDKIANDPLKKNLTTTAEVRYGPAGAAKGQLVLALVAGSTAVVDKRADDSVDLVLGAKYKTLAPPVAATTSPPPATACEP